MATNTTQTTFEWVTEQDLQQAASATEDTPTYPDSPYVSAMLDRRERATEAAQRDAKPSLPAGREDRCQTCESPVTQRYRRVAGDRHDIAWACPTCATYMQRFDGAAADPDYPLDDIRAGGDRHE